MRTLLLFCALQMLALSAANGQNYYTVKFPDDVTVVGCGATPDVVYPEITKTGYCSFNVGVAMSDMVFTLNATGGCKKILRTWTLLWWCDYNPNWPGPTYIENPGYTEVGATAVGNSTNHGYLRYTQIIKVLDNNPPIFLNCPTTTPVFCDNTNNDPLQYNNGIDLCEGPVNLNVKVTDVCSKSDIMLSYRLYLDLDGNGTMETYRSSGDPNAWPIERTIINDTLSAKIKLPPGVGLPYAKHKIEWIANDNCGNQTLCKYEFIVKDCKPPTVVCINGLSVNIMPTGMITFWDTDFLKYTYDNCTPTNQIKLGIRKAGTGVGFPYDSHSVTFTCAELGKNFVELWAVDAYGNADYCTTYLIVQDHLGSCSNSPLVVNDHQPGTLTTAGTTLRTGEEQAPETQDRPTGFAGDQLLFYPVMPNPTTGPMQVKYWLPAAGPVTVRLVDMQGRVVNTTTDYHEAGYQQTDLQAEASGLLFLQLQWAGGSEVQRVVVQQ
ncbi:MAG: T9SS type A sorting domain-containing protein [Saprospiraceae bacterium]